MGGEGEREREREGCGVQAGQEGVRDIKRTSRSRSCSMEIRPDRFKAVAGKTLGKIHRYTPIPNIPECTLTLPDLTRWFRMFLFCRTLQFILLWAPILSLLTINTLVMEKFIYWFELGKEGLSIYHESSG